MLQESRARTSSPETTERSAGTWASGSGTRVAVTTTSESGVATGGASDWARAVEAAASTPRLAAPIRRNHDVSPSKETRGRLYRRGLVGEYLRFGHERPSPAPRQNARLRVSRTVNLGP